MFTRLGTMLVSQVSQSLSLPSQLLLPLPQGRGCFSVEGAGSIHLTAGIPEVWLALAPMGQAQLVPIFTSR